MLRLVFVLVVAFGTVARADTYAAPAGGKPFAIPGGLVACADAAGGWHAEATRHALRPADKPGTAQLAVAATPAACTGHAHQVTLIATAPWPAITGATLALDDGVLELRGHRLAGTVVRWRAGSQTGEARCDAPTQAGADEVCRMQVAADATASWSFVPAGVPADAALFAADGQPVGPDALALPAPRVELGVLVRPDAAIDAFEDGAVVPLRHADLITAVDCAPAECVIDGNSLLVNSVPAGAASLAIRVRLASHVALRRGNAAETAPVLRIPIVRCPLEVASGTPIRGVESQRVVVKLGGRCARDVERMRFQVGGMPAEKGRVLGSGDATFVVLRIGRTDAEAISIAAMLDSSDTDVAHVRVRTRPAPTARVGLELRSGRPIDFIPTNVDAHAHVTAADWDGSAAVAPIDGVYAVSPKGEVRGVAGAGGLVAMRVVLRRNLPPPLGSIEITTVADPVQRAVREAASQAPLLDGVGGPLVELACDTGHGVTSIAPGALAHVPFDHHDSCRLVLHRERLDPAMGAQHLALELEVTRVDGSQRSEASVNRTITIVHDKTPRTMWLKGAENRFDRYTVRLSQQDEGGSGEDLPSAQWNVVTGTGHARIYATSAIPTGLYRVSDHDHSGILTLNFGVLARITWLDSLGREGILCGEAGVMTVGLANDTSSTGKSLTQVGAVMGVGLSVPIANRALAAETAVNLHAWVEFEPSRAFGSGSGSAWALVFGPSITVGNLGADL